jgi:hypothetical protein
MSDERRRLITNPSLITNHSSLTTFQMNDTLIFLVLAGLALVFKWLTSHAAGDPEKPEPPPPNEPAQRRAPPQSEEERVRRFLEALGAPPGTQPPPAVRRRSVVPRPAVIPAPQPQRPPKVRRSFVQPLPPLTTTPPELVLVEAAPPPVMIAPPLPSLAPPLAAPITSLSPLKTTSKAVTSRALSTRSLGALLRNPGGIRQAIMLREVLGPPRGLQALDNSHRF